MNNEKFITYQLVTKTKIKGYRDARTKQPLMPTGERKMRLMDTIIDPDTGEERYICYVKGESDIFLDKQRDKDPKKRVEYVTFEHGFTRVNAQDKNLIKFMDMSKRCEGSKYSNNRNKPIYKRLDRKKIAEEGMRLDSSIAKAKNMCYEGDWNEVKAYAKVKGIPVDEMQSSEVRHNLGLQINEKTVEKFLADFGSRTVRLKYYAIEAIDKGYIVVDRHSRAIVWADTRQVILAYAEGRVATDELANYLMRPEGERAYELILSYLGINKPEPKKEESVYEKNTKEAIEKMDVYDLVNLGFKEEVIKLGSDNSFRFKGSKIGGTQEKVHTFFTEGKGVDKVDDLRQAVIDSFK